MTESCSLLRKIRSLKYSVSLLAGSSRTQSTLPINEVFRRFCFSVEYFCDIDPEYVSAYSVRDQGHFESFLLTNRLTLIAASCSIAFAGGARFTFKNRTLEISRYVPYRAKRFYFNKVRTICESVTRFNVDLHSRVFFLLINHPRIKIEFIKSFLLYTRSRYFI